MFANSIELELISSGASITLFSFSANENEAKIIRNEVEKWLRCGLGKREAQKALQHATFAVEIVELGSDFLKARERSLMKVRLLQMRAPNVSFGPLKRDDLDGIPSGFCDIDQKRARSINLKKQPHTSIQQLDGSSYSAAEDKNFASQATHHRRAYGRTTKVSIYQMVAGKNQYLKDFPPAWEFEQIGRRDTWRVGEDKDVNRRDPYAEAAGKIAVIYLDGNRFSKLINKEARTLEIYQDIDRELQDKRKELMKKLVEFIKDKPYWRVKPPKLSERTRIETLLWGGDELIWVVPAWCALETVQFFFKQTSNWELRDKRLTHALGMVICSYATPIRAVVSLARELAENVKDHLDDLGKEAISHDEISESLSQNPSPPTPLPANGARGDGNGIGSKNKTDPQHEAFGNAMAYEVLESFDHLGRDFQEARRGLRFPQMSETDAILTADGLQRLVEHLELLKRGNGPNEPALPARRLHQIARLFYRSNFAIDSRLSEDKVNQQLENTSYGRLIKRIAETQKPADEAEYKKELNNPLHWKSLDKLPAKWFHLLELWKYTGY